VARSSSRQAARAGRSARTQPIECRSKLLLKEGEKPPSGDVVPQGLRHETLSVLAILADICGLRSVTSIDTPAAVAGRNSASLRHKLPSALQSARLCSLPHWLLSRLSLRVASVPGGLKLGLGLRDGGGRLGLGIRS